MVWKLAIVEIEGERFFDDKRLREYRHVDKIMHVIRYDEPGDRQVKVLQQAGELLTKKGNKPTRKRWKL